VPRLRFPRLEAREHLVYPRERPALGRGEAGKDEVLLDVEAAEDAAVLVHELHAALRDRVALAARELDPLEAHGAAARRDHAHEALQRRALARAVAPQKRHHLVALDPQRDVEEDVRIAVIAVEPGHFEQAHAASSPFTPPR
jgi:hypothetical protein